MGEKKLCSSFITIKYGASDEKIFNPDCTMRLLVDSIKKRCRCPPCSALVLAAENTADILELPENMENGKTYFEDRGAYVLLTIQRREGKQPVYTSLLDMEYMGQVLTEKLENLNSAKMTTDQSQQNRLLKPKPRQKQSRESRSQGSRKTSTASLRAKK